MHIVHFNIHNDCNAEKNKNIKYRMETVIELK